MHLCVYRLFHLYLSYYKEEPLFHTHIKNNKSVIYEKSDTIQNSFCVKRNKNSYKIDIFLSGQAS